MASVDTLFQAAVDQDASDIHLVAGQPPMIRVGGALQQVSEEPIAEKDLASIIESVTTAVQRATFEESHELDLGYQVGETRFRINLHKQEGTLGLAARVIPHEIPSPDDLRFEPILREASDYLNGLVLVVGPTGHGKSTTLASMVEEINKKKKSHIITIEDPIEFAFVEKESLIEQREIGTDTTSFAEALKHVLRQDPNVILVGEMRDPETIATALTAAETGHLVFSTLHTSTAAEAVERIVDVFDGPKQQQILVQLSAVLRVVVAQQLVPTVDGGRVAAREILVNTPAVANLIRENNIAQIKSSLQTGAKTGMVTMENSLKALAKEGVIDPETVTRRSGTTRLE